MWIQIRVKGHIDPIWQVDFEELHITHEENGTSLLSGIVQDQAALYGALLKIRALSVSLLALETKPNDPRSSAQQDERIR